MQLLSLAVSRFGLLPCDHFGIGQHQRAYALGIVADHRLAEVVGQRAVTVILAAQTGHQADAAQLQAADTLRSRKLTCAESVLVSSTAVLEVNAADAVVLVADCSCSRYSSVNDQKEQIARLGKTVLGCVVYE